MRNPIIRRMWGARIDAKGFDGGFTIGEDAMHFALPAAGGMHMIDSSTGEPEKGALATRLSSVAVVVLLYWLAPGGSANNRKFVLALLLASFVGRRASM